MSLQTGVEKILNNKKFSIMGSIGMAANTIQALDEYKTKRLEGNGKVGSAISAVGDAIMFDAIGLPGMIGLGAIKSVPTLAVNGFLGATKMARSMDRSSRNVAFNNATFVDTPQAYTMRQAGMQIAEASRYNLQQTLLGNEASSMHRI